MLLCLDVSKYKDIKNDVEFVEKLIGEQSVVTLPGKCFKCPGDYIRIVITNPSDKLEIAFKRIHTFCLTHAALE